MLSKKFLSTQDDVETPREPVILELPSVLMRVLEKDRHLVRVKHYVCFCRREILTCD